MRFRDRLGIQRRIRAQASARKWRMSPKLPVEWIHRSSMINGDLYVRGGIFPVGNLYGTVISVHCLIPGHGDVEVERRWPGVHIIPSNANSPLIREFERPMALRILSERYQSECLLVEQIPSLTRKQAYGKAGLWREKDL